MSESRRLRLAVVVSCLMVAVVVLRLLVAAPVTVAGHSMAPTLREGQVVLVGTVGGPDLSRGDLVVFRSPVDGTDSIKRVVGLPGDSVVIRDAVLSVNDSPVEEPYVDRTRIDGLFTPTTEVPPGRVFVLGDNRARSIDSRAYGPVSLDRVQGRVAVRLWPLGCADVSQPCR